MGRKLIDSNGNNLIESTNLLRSNKSFIDATISYIKSSRAISRQLTGTNGFYVEYNPKNVPGFSKYNLGSRLSIPITSTVISCSFDFIKNPRSVRAVDINGNIVFILDLSSAVFENLRNQESYLVSINQAVSDLIHSDVFYPLYFDKNLNRVNMSLLEPILKEYNKDIDSFKELFNSAGGNTSFFDDLIKKCSVYSELVSYFKDYISDFNPVFKMDELASLSGHTFSEYELPFACVNIDKDSAWFFGSNPYSFKKCRRNVIAADFINSVITRKGLRYLTIPYGLVSFYMVR